MALPALHPLSPGERVGDWILQHPIGRGGMGAVFRCENMLSPRLCGAMKVVAPDELQQLRARFVREMDTLASLRHPAIVRVLSGGEDREHGVLFLVMELIEGVNLSDVLKEKTLPWRTATRVFRQLADGLRHAHEHGIAHRDIKPSNIMVTAEGSAVLVDFGVALDQERSRLTEAGFVPGTVEYIAPEFFQANVVGKLAESAGDTYGLGLVLYEALTGKRAFELPKGLPASVRLAQLVHRKFTSGPLDPGEAFPGRLRQLIGACTHPDPKIRPPIGTVALGLAELVVTEPDEDTHSPDERTEVHGALDKLYAALAEDTFVVPDVRIPLPRPAPREERRPESEQELAVTAPPAEPRILTPPPVENPDEEATALASPEVRAMIQALARGELPADEAVAPELASVLPPRQPVYRHLDEQERVQEFERDDLVATMAEIEQERVALARQRALVRLLLGLVVFAFGLFAFGAALIAWVIYSMSA